MKNCDRKRQTKVALRSFINVAHVVWWLEDTNNLCGHQAAAGSRQEEQSITGHDKRQLNMARMAVSESPSREAVRVYTQPEPLEKEGKVLASLGVHA